VNNLGRHPVGQGEVRMMHPLLFFCTFDSNRFPRSIRDICSASPRIYLVTLQLALSLEYSLTVMAYFHHSVFHAAGSRIGWALA